MPLKSDEADKLIDVIRGFVADDKATGGPQTSLDAVAGPNGKVSLEHMQPIEPGRPTPGARTSTLGTLTVNPNQPFDEEALYQRFRARIIDDAQIDPILLKLLTTQPELIVEYERREVVYDDTSLRGRIAKLIAAGFLDTPRKNAAIDAELGKTGSRPNSGRLSEAITDLVGSGFLVRLGDGVQKAPGVKITERDLVVKA